MADKVKEINEYNHLRGKYGWLGNPDTSRTEFMVNINRETYAALAQHDGLLYYNSVVLNQHPETTRQQTLKKIVNPIRPKK